MKGITKEQENFLNKCTNGNWGLNRETGLVDVDGSFDCSYMGLSDFMGIEFGDISQNFNCSRNELVSLEGAPQKVGGYFDCSNNQLVSLEGAPQEVGGGFYCSNNKLVSLKGSPQRVDGWFDCSHNQLPSLEGSPQNVGSIFYCYNNRLVSLKRGPIRVGGEYYCYNNQLASLEGAPEELRYKLYCDCLTMKNFPIHLFDKIFFYRKEGSISVERLMKKMADGLSYESYLEKMI